MVETMCSISFWGDYVYFYFKGCKTMVLSFFGGFVLKRCVLLSNLTLV